MKKLLGTLTLCFGILSALPSLSHASSLNNFPTLFSLVPPAAALIVNDLDVDDNFNRRVRSSAAKKRFQKLWKKILSHFFLLPRTQKKLKINAIRNKNGTGTKNYLARGA